MDQFCLWFGKDIYSLCKAIKKIKQNYLNNNVGENINQGWFEPQQRLGHAWFVCFLILMGGGWGLSTQKAFFHLSPSSQGQGHPVILLAVFAEYKVIQWARWTVTMLLLWTVVYTIYCCYALVKKNFVLNWFCPWFEICFPCFWFIIIPQNKEK